jgi:hypothetical protein
VKFTKAVNFMISDIISTATGAVQSSLILILAGSQETSGGADVSDLQLSARLLGKKRGCLIAASKIQG